MNKLPKHSDWKPLVSQQGLEARAFLNAQIRKFFAARNVLEVETPIINFFTVTDPHIDSISVNKVKHVAFLHTSPEYAMKRLLADFKRDIYQLCKVFRAAEVGKYHHPEFTMLEWYRVGWSYQDLIHEVDELIASLLQNKINLSQTKIFTYQDIFIDYCGFDPWQAKQLDYSHACDRAGISPSTKLSNQEYQELLLDQVIAQQLPKDRLTFIYDYPAQQAALAKLNSAGMAERFELYLGNIELANGFQELTNAQEQLARFEADNQMRQKSGKEKVVIDKKFIAALKAGLPYSAGVALGVDRLLMLILGIAEIRDVLVFPHG